MKYEQRDKEKNLMGNIFLKILKTKKQSVKNKRGFTLVELLVVFFIMGTILAVIIPDYIGYSTKVELKNLALDIALTIREAQAYGAGAKVTQGGSFDTRYGVHFVKGANSFILFENTSNGNGNDNVYSLADNIISTYTIKNGYSIDEICDANNLSECSPGNSTVSSLTALDIVFKRPNPGASIKAGGTGPYVDGFTGEKSNAEIVLVSPDQTRISVTIESPGTISVGS